MFNSFSSALSALKAHSTAVDTVGNNLANVNTTGFKSTDVVFKDLVAESLNASSEVGMGVNRPMTVRSFTQGAVQSTSGLLDAAIQGSGFFVAKSPSNERLFTRDGSFQVDSEGFVTTLTKERVQQYANGQLSDIRVPTGTSQAQATTQFALTVNLNAAGVTGAASGKFSAPVEIVDSLGVKHVLTVEYTKTGANEWDAEVFIPGADVGDSDPLVSVGTVSLEFDSTGKLTTPAAADGPVDITINDLVSNAADATLSFNLFDDAGKSTITQFATTSAVSNTVTDGFPSAELVSVGMTDGGNIVGRYANGEVATIGTLAMAMVANPSSLTSAGNNFFRPTSESADATYGVAETGGRGKIKAGALEASTVDIAREFTNLIVYQRGYQANSRVITTADELSQETLNLKR